MKKVKYILDLMKLVVNILLMLLLYPVCSYGQIQNQGNLRMHSGSDVGIFGDFSNEGTFTNNLGALHIVGSSLQTLNGTNLIHTNNLIIDKSNNSLKLDNVLQIGGVLTFSNGSIVTDEADIATEFVEFLDGASYTGASDANHIDGVVRKTGNDAFDFPTGDSSTLRTISISAPGSITDHFTAFYSATDPDGSYSRNSLESGIDNVSACEYWILNRTGGSSNVEVTLSWGSNSCEVNILCDLLVSRWDGSQWTSEGNGGYTGTTDSGTVVSGADCTTPAPVSNFSPFTLGSTTNGNLLPISLTSFDASVCIKSVCLEWQTATEINNDFFTLEKSVDGVNWEAFHEVAGAGNSQTILNYSVIDHAPFSGYSYYRLKQTDFDGHFEYSSIKLVYFDAKDERRLIIYPNPSQDIINLQGLRAEINQVQIFNSVGQEVNPDVKFIQRAGANVQVDISLLSPGMYHVKTNKKYSCFVKL